MPESSALRTSLRRLLPMAAALLLTLPAGASDSTTVFNEIMFHPATGETEWIEVANLMAVDMDLSGWRITDGIDYTFPEGTVIAGGGRLVISNAPAAVPGSIGPWAGKLDNGGELIRLVNVSGRVMDELDYRDGGQWPLGPDGSGATLSRVREGAAESGPDAWVSSGKIGGTPGEPNFPDGFTRIPGVRISEITAAAETAFRVELVNESATALSLAGMKLGNYALPATVLPPGGLAVFEESQTGIHPVEKERLFLYGTDGALLDAVIVKVTAQARHGEEMLVAAAATFGSANVFDLSTDVVINEILFRSPPFSSDPGSPAVVETSVILPMDAVWRYFTGAGSPGTWWQTTFHASEESWIQGPALLGFESTPAVLPEPLRTALANTGATAYYFETSFSLTPEALAGLTVLRLEHVIDDGAVFYLNGVEIPGTRLNLPDGPISHATTTTAGIGNATVSDPLDVPAESLSLVAGLNRLSVEVHQQIATSSDMVCGVRISAVTRTTPAAPAMPVRSNPQEWVELYNKGMQPANLSGWQLDDAVKFTFPADTQLAAGDFLVVARDADTLRAAWPDRAGKIMGGLTGNLSNRGERIELKDARGNPADVARYLPGLRSNGGGSSLELRDARDDNALPPAWSDSDQTRTSEWRIFSWRTTAAQRFGPSTWNEFRLGMLDAGECLVDDLSVIRDPDGNAQEIIQNGNFESLPAGAHWRLLGNHSGSAVVEDPSNPANHVLYLSATGPAETNHNHAETTFTGNQALSSSAIYEIRFRARWLSGTNQLNTRAYYQKLATTWELPIPEKSGTPAAANSRAVANGGPVLSALRHTPAVPAANTPVTVSLDASDPDGIGAATLHYRLNGSSVFSSVPMALTDGRWSASVPGQAAAAIVQFYAEVTDAAAVPAHSLLPGAGPDSRALVQWRDNQSTTRSAHELRLIMLTSDRTFLMSNLNRLSNDRIPATLVYRGNEVFHDVGVRLQGTAAGRVRDGEDYVGYDIGFPADHLFRGVHESVGVDRSGRAPVTRRQDEIYVRHTFNRAGIPCTFDDLCYFIAPVTGHTGTAILQMASYGGVWVSSQHEKTTGTSGTVFNWDITYDPTSVSTANNPESLKPPVPFVHVATDLTDLGDDKEQYRGPFDIRAGKRQDDYTGLMGLAKTMGLPTGLLIVQAPEILDLDEVLRCTALVNLWGIGDSYYTGGLHHNIRLFVPESGKGVQFLPWDMDFTMSGGTNSALYPSGNNLGRLISGSQSVRRRYLGHIRNLCETVFRADYLSPWLTRYGTVVGQTYSTTASYVTSRRAYAKTQYPTATAFAVTTNNGADFTTEESSVSLEGNAWIDVREIQIKGAPLPLSWPTLTRWKATVPLVAGPNLLTLQAYGYDNALVGTVTLTITSHAALPTGFSAWQTSGFTPQELGNPAISGPLADPSASGWGNLLRYAFGLTARGPVIPPPVVLTSTATALRLEFPRLKNAGDIEYVPESSTTLQDWTTLPSVPEILRDNGDGTETVRVEAPTGNGSQYLRLRVRSK